MNYRRGGFETKAMTSAEEGGATVSDSGRQLGDCVHGGQRWTCEICRLRAAAERLAAVCERFDKWADGWCPQHRCCAAGCLDIANDARAAVGDYRKAVGS